jgi:hypothetical protein
VASADDATTGTVVSDKVIMTFGSECVDVTEHADGNQAVGNTCADNLEPGADGGRTIELRSSENVVEDNTISGSAGLGVKVAADPGSPVPSANVIRDSTIIIAPYPAISVTPAGGASACGNTIGAGEATVGIPPAVAEAPC